MDQYRLSQSAFLLIFGGFFLYHSLAAFEVIAVPLPLGGWWSLANLLAVIVLGSVFLLSRELLRAGHVPFITLCLWVAGVVVWHRYQGNEWQRLDFVLGENAKLLIGWAAFYLVGLYLRLTRGFSALVAGLVVAFSLAVPFLIQTDPFSPLDDVRRRFMGEVANYQFFANALAFMAIAALAGARSVTTQAGILLAASTGIFFLGSRSETVGMAMVAGLWLSATWLQTHAFSWRLAAGSLAILLVAIGAGFILNAEALNRYMDAVDLAKSQSWQLRSGFHNDGLVDIRAAWLWGEYAGQMKGHPIGTTSEQTLAFGTYIHNGLSLWRQHGFVPFLLFVGLCTAALVKGIWRVFVTRDSEPETRMLLYVAAYSMLLLLFSKSVYWPMPALAWGLLTTAVMAERDTEREARRPLTQQPQSLQAPGPFFSCLKAM
jgi:hypothetical protein